MSIGPALDELIVELRAGRYVRRTMLALSDGVSVLLPVEETLDMLELLHASGQDSLVTALLEPQGQEISLHPWSGLAMRDGTSIQGATAVKDWIPYADSQLLADWLQIRAQVDMAGLVVHLESIDELPLGRRLRRERMRLAGSGTVDSKDFDIRLDSERALLSGFVVDWSGQFPGVHRVQ